MKGGGGRTHFRLLFSRTEAVGETEMKILHEYISCLTLFRDGKNIPFTLLLLCKGHEN